MKKYVAVATAVVFLLGFAAASFAIHAEIPAETQAVVAKSQTQITVGGEVRVRGEMRNNIRDFNSDKVDHDAYWDERFRLSVEAKVTPNTMAKFTLQSGNADNQDNVTWGAYDPGPGAKGSYPFGNANKGDVRFLEAWLLHQGSGLLGVPALVKVGHMPIIVGTGMWLNHTYWGDDALLFGVDPMKELHIILGTVKFTENQTPAPNTGAALALNNDGDAYVLLMTYDFDKKSSIGFNVTYVNQQNIGHTSVTDTGVYPDVELWNFGLNGNFNLGGVDLYGEFNLQTGKTAQVVNPFFNSGREYESDFQGWAAKAGGYFKVDPVKLGLEFAWGSGGRANQDNTKTFQTTLGNEQHFSYVYEYRTVNAANNALGGLQNTWYIRGDAAMDFTKEFSGYLALYYLQAVNKIDSFTIQGPTGPQTRVSYGFANTNDSKNIGFEIDAKFNYKIDRNLNYWVEGGYLFAGNFWKAVSTSVDDAWAVRQGIQLSF